jgi:hypothetical protein
MIKFVRTYRCNACGNCQSLEAGTLGLWADCDKCHGPAHW